MPEVTSREYNTSILILPIVSSLSSFISYWYDHSNNPCRRCSIDPNVSSPLRDSILCSIILHTPNNSRESIHCSIPSLTHSIRASLIIPPRCLSHTKSVHFPKMWLVLPISLSLPSFRSPFPFPSFWPSIVTLSLSLIRFGLLFLSPISYLHACLLELIRDTIPTRFFSLSRLNWEGPDTRNILCERTYQSLIDTKKLRRSHPLTRYH